VPFDRPISASISTVWITAIPAAEPIVSDSSSDLLRQISQHGHVGRVSETNKRYGFNGGLFVRGGGLGR
jgi:hypothetical protein